LRYTGEHHRATIDGFLLTDGDRPMKRQPLITFLILTLTGLPLVGEKELGAFHSGGAGECDGCHTIHGIQGGVPGIPPGPFLLKGSDSGSVCLNCHQQSGDFGPTSIHISTPPGEMPPGLPPKQLSPGGDFGWLKKNYTWTPALGSPMDQSPGDGHGHNIVAFDYGYFQDSFLASAPGGSYPASSLTCVSCHDPHGSYRRNMDGSYSTTGKPVRESGSSVSSPGPDAITSVGSYRLLGGSGYFPKSLGGSHAFVNKPPDALAPDIYNRSEALSMTRVAYGTGISEWCLNCHGSIHNGGSGSLEHPIGPGDGELRRDNILNHYNSYIKTGDLGGTEATSYLSLVPFEIGTANYTTLRTIITATPTKGPSEADGTPLVMCLTCHRAHASGWDNMTRWNTRAQYLATNGSYAQEGMAYQPNGQGRSEAEAVRAYYDIPASRFAPLQTTLCTKCHESVPD
jgi:hypothetical protein